MHRRLQSGVWPAHAASLSAITCTSQSIGKGVVREVRNGGRYLVDVKARQLVAADAQLTPVEPRKQREAAPAEHHVRPDEDPPPRTHAAASIDLHGMTTDEAVAALDAFLNDAILAGLPGGASDPRPERRTTESRRPRLVEGGHQRSRVSCRRREPWRDGRDVVRQNDGAQRNPEYGAAAIEWDRLCR